jgi:hypothetical protein
MNKELKRRYNHIYEFFCRVVEHNPKLIVEMMEREKQL